MLTTPEGVLQTDHPRSRGEYSRICRSWRSRCGSSPLSRGILEDLPQLAFAVRIIPALAGNTLAPGRWTGRKRDHPRSRGEYRFRAASTKPWNGSSPLSRGIRVPTGSRHVDLGIIPALAGNTHSPPCSSHKTTDHPRSRGEYCWLSGSCCGVSGSSPLSRGIPHRCGPESPPKRIIPALAGNTTAAWPQAAATQDHPRSRGEYHSISGLIPSRAGSSPLSRGIPRVPGLRDRELRIIPALAGNTTGR